MLKNHHSRKAVSAILLVLKWSGAIFRPRSSTPSLRFFNLCPFQQKIKTSGFSLEIPALENIPQFPENRAEVDQNHDARKAVSATLSVLKYWVAIFWPRSSKLRVQKVLLGPFYCKPRPSGISLEYIPLVPENRAEVAQYQDARKSVSANLLVFKWSGVLFRSRSSKLCVQKLFLFPFHCKPRPARVSLESPGLVNISQVPGNRAEVDQNHDARNVVSATVSVLKWSGPKYSHTSL